MDAWKNGWMDGLRERSVGSTYQFTPVKWLWWKHPMLPASKSLLRMAQLVSLSSWWPGCGVAQHRFHGMPGSVEVVWVKRYDQTLFFFVWAEILIWSYLTHELLLILGKAFSFFNFLFLKRFSVFIFMCYLFLFCAALAETFHTA